MSRENGGGGRNRTAITGSSVPRTPVMLRPLIDRQSPEGLSYCMAGPRGFEPPPDRLRGDRSVLSEPRALDARVRGAGFEPAWARSTAARLASRPAPVNDLCDSHASSGSLRSRNLQARRRAPLAGSELTCLPSRSAMLSLSDPEGFEPPLCGLKGRRPAWLGDRSTGAPPDGIEPSPSA